MIRKAIRKVDIDATFYLNETTKYYDVRIQQYIKDRQANGWSIYVAKHTHGWCRWTSKQLVIPYWVLRKDIGYRTWYIAHELAHSYVTFKDDHGPRFMEQLMRICPKEYQMHEYGYMCKEALAAGLHVSKDMLI